MIAPALALALGALSTGTHLVRPATPERGEAVRPEVERSTPVNFWTPSAVRLRAVETRLIERIAPPNESGLDGTKPTFWHGLLNLFEVAGERLGVMRPAKVYNAWVAPGRLMRGSELDAAGFAELARQGIDTVINLKREDHSEQPLVEALGMRSVYIPFYDQSLPSPREIAAFLAVAEDPASGKVYVHCEHGVGRTGVMVAIYRIHHDGFTAEAALAEAKSFGMNSAPQLAFIQRYADALGRGAAWTR